MTPAIAHLDTSPRVAPIGSRQSLLAAALAVLLTMMAGTAQADPHLYFDVGLPSATSVLLLPTASPALKRSTQAAIDSTTPRQLSVLEAFGGSLASELSKFDEMLGSHRIKWRYDQDWSSSLGSDYPRFSTPSYLVGNGSPGVAQRVWVQFSLVRRF